MFLVILFGSVILLSTYGLYEVYLTRKATKSFVDLKLKRIINLEVESAKLKAQINNIDLDSITKKIKDQQEVDRKIVQALEDANEEIDEALKEVLETKATVDLHKAWQKELYEKVNRRIDQIPRTISFEPKGPLPIELKNLNLEFASKVYRSKDGKVKRRGIIRNQRPKSKEQYNMPKVKEVKKAMLEAGL
jgi:hypothetical protein